MKKLNLMIMVLVLIPVVIGQGVPEDTSVQQHQLIQQEHKNTRKFFSDELTRQKNDFFKMMDDRANYYESTFFSALATTSWKLGLMWAGVVSFLVGLYSIMRVKLDRKKYKLLSHNVAQQVSQQVLIALNQNPSAMPPTQSQSEEQVVPNVTLQKPIYAPNGNTIPAPPLPPSRKEQRAMDKHQRKMERLDKEIAKLEQRKQKMNPAPPTAPQQAQVPIPPQHGLPQQAYPQPPQQQQPPAYGAPQQPPQKKKSELQYGFEVSY